MILARLLILAAFGLVVSSGGARAADVSMGLAAPLSGPSAALGQQIQAGARAALADAAPDAATLTVSDTGCEAAGGARAARELVAARVRIVVGFLCTEAIEAALPILTEAGIPVLNVGVRANRLTDRRERTGALVWRVGLRSDAEADAIAATLLKRWRNEPFGFLEDGSIANRALVDQVRRRLGDAGMEPSANDNYRPAEEKQFGLVRRLERTGVTRFFVAGDRPDVAVILRDGAEIGLDLSVIGGESLMDETSADLPLADGVLAVLPPIAYPDLPRPPGEAADSDPRRGYYGPAFAAAEIAVAAARRAGEGNAPLPQLLSESVFETRLGPVRFDDKGDADLIRYRPMVWREGRFREPADG